MRFNLLVGLLSLLLSSCGRPTDQSLASHGTINKDAPVKATAQIIIAAPANRVWDILTDIQNWPSWQTDITIVAIDQQPAVGVSFEWSTGAGNIHSRVALYKPQRQIAWTGRLLAFHAIHVWTITSLPNGKTLVTTSESMSGWPIALFFTSNDLLDADRRWLVYLAKKAAS